MKSSPILLSALCMFLLLGCNNNTNKTRPVILSTGPVAPEINTKYGWLNSDKPYVLSDFHGKIVLLDFWTYGCINCQHILPDLEKLQTEYAGKLVVIGIHSAKFDSEKSNARIISAIARFGITHPVVNDADYAIWNAYKVQAWPGVTLISPDGKIVLQREGENVYKAVKPKIDELIQNYGDSITNNTIIFRAKKDSVAGNLKFPSKMTADGKGGIWLADNGNNRIVNIDQDGSILEIIGAGKPGFTDGNFKDATFNAPQGLALKGNILYIADSKNNSIRAADLDTKQVKTIAGNGQMGYYYNNDKLNEPVLPNTPWDLAIDSNYLYIASAGNHQLLRMNLTDNKVYRFAGSGSEGIKNGSMDAASFAQPSGLVKEGTILYDADPEASAIRKIDLTAKTVQTIIGKGLFKFGDKNGKLPDVLLQHCTGLAVDKNKIYIADSYNGKVKLLDLTTQTVNTLVDGLDEPNDVLIVGDKLWITDTNNNQLIRVSLNGKDKEVVQVKQQ